jgi:hypothetical protein
MLFASDLPWMLRELEAASDDASADEWTAAAQMALWRDLTDDAVHRLLDAARPGSRVERAFRGELTPVALDSAAAAEGRRMAAKYGKLAKAVQRRPAPTEADIDEEIAARVAKAHSRTAWKRWPQLCFALNRDVGDHRSAWPEALSSRPAWQRLDGGTRAAVLRVAVAFLRRSHDHADEWISRNGVPFHAHAGWAALRLLNDAAPDLSDSLEAAVWRRWVGAVVAHHDEDGPDPVLARAYRAAPGATIATARRYAEAESRHHGRVFVFRRFRDVWDSAVANAVAELAGCAELALGAVEELLGLLLEHGEASATTLALEFTRRGARSPSGSPRRQRGVGAFAALLAHADRRGRRALLTLMREDPDFARDAVGHFARQHYRDGAAQIARVWPLVDLADLYARLLAAAPPSRAPEADDFHWSGFRDGVMRVIVDSGSADAVAQLDRIARENDMPPWFGFYRRDAMERYLAKKWIPVDPALLRALLVDASSRRVDSPAQLTDVLIECLEEVGRDLHGSPTVVHLLWNDADGSRPKPKRERDLSDFLTHELALRLRATGVLVHREVELRRRTGRDSGQLIDIHVTGEVGSAPADVARVVLEVKGDWNRDAEVDIERQLADRYLRGPAVQHGIYVVGVFGAKRRGRAWEGIESVREHFAARAAALTSVSRSVRAVVLDCRLSLSGPTMPARPRQVSSSPRSRDVAAASGRAARARDPRRKR